MASLYPRILFFISGPVPTPEQVEEADDLGPGVMFRNATLIVADGPIEDADAVAGDVPENYAKALPSVDDRDAVRARVMKRNPNLAIMGKDEPRHKETAEQEAARIETALARGAKPAPINERNADPARPSERLTQSGHSRVATAAPASADGWGTDPNTLDAGDGEGGEGEDTGQPSGAPASGVPAPAAKPPAAPAKPGARAKTAK